MGFYTPCFHCFLLPRLSPLSCIVLVLFLYCTCIVAPTLSIHSPGTLHTSHIIHQTSPCIVLVLYLYLTGIVVLYFAFRSFPSIKPLSTSPCIVLILYLYCGVQSISIIYHLSPRPPCIVLVLCLYCQPQPIITTLSSHYTPPHTHANLVLCLHCACILLVLCLCCHSAAPFAFSCNALYTSIPLSVNRYF